MYLVFFPVDDFRAHLPHARHVGRSFPLRDAERRGTILVQGFPAEF